MVIYYYYYFCEEDQHKMENMFHVLEVFGFILRLKVNLEKSVMCGMV